MVGVVCSRSYMSCGGKVLVVYSYLNSNGPTVEVYKEVTAEQFRQYLLFKKFKRLT